MVNPENWRAKTQLNDEMADVIEARATPIELPSWLGILASRWQNAMADAPPAVCAAIPGYEAPPARN